MLLASSFRDFDSAKTYPTWREIFSNLQAFHLWNFDGVAEDEEEDDFVPREIDNIPWMPQAGVVQNGLVRNILTGERELYRQFNWFAAFQKYDDILNNINFIQRFKETNPSAHNNRIHQPIILNQEQKEIINYLTDQFHNRTTNKRCLILGAASVGKSLIINEIVKVTESFYGNNSVRVVAPTGCAADNIHCQTIHSALKLHRKKCFVETTKI